MFYMTRKWERNGSDPPSAFQKLGSRVLPPRWCLFGVSDLMLDQCLKGKKLRRTVFPIDQNADAVPRLCVLQPFNSHFSCCL